MNEKADKIKTDTIITSHVNSDFDSIASMLAAQKLYPDSVVIFPGSQEKSMKNFFISSMSYLFNMESPGSIDFSCVKRLVLVDTRQKSRVPAVAELIERSLYSGDIEIHIYDHHPRQEDDIKGSMEISQPSGATVTILSRIIRERKISISPDEATIMALGIYEDTGSFTYSSTTESDFIEAGFLVSRGASINTIASFVTREISTTQVSWLNELLSEISCHRINGFDIHISTISSHSYIYDLASIVQKVVKIEDINVFFAIVLMDNKINIIARSRIFDVDVGRILSIMGGGGHTYAASAKITEKTLAQVEMELLEVIKNTVRLKKIVPELMSSPPIIIEASVPCKKASRMMTRYNINSLLVSEDDRNNIVGYISRQVIEKILYHNLDHLPVKEYMTTEVSSISTDSDIPEIQQKIMDGKQRILPVIDNGEVIGVITRTDLFNFLLTYGKNMQIPAGTPRDENSIRNARKRNIEPFMKERLDDHILDLLRDIGIAGDQVGLTLFVVGGFVRDLLLFRESDDIDIVVEGDGITFAKQLAAVKQGRCNIHPEFRTAVVILPDGFKIDVASARLEYYKSPAALPTVEMSSIKSDLFRRDFTINTLAIQLNTEGFGTLIDFFGAQRDLKDKTIRTIHNLSFVEDPTRVFRAIKFANRFGFSIGKLTLSLIKNTIKLGFFENLSGLRVFSEIKQILEEENPITAIEYMKDYQLDRVIHQEFYIDKETINLMSSVRNTLAWHDLLYLEVDYLRWSIYFMVMMRRIPIKICEDICEKFRLSPRQTNIILRDRLRAEEKLFLLEKSIEESSATENTGSEKNEPFRNSSLYNLLSIFKSEHIMYMMATTRKEETRKSISFYYTQLRDVTVSIRGKDLMSMGIKPGPDYRNIIQEVLEAKLDGIIETRDDELDFAAGLIKNSGKMQIRRINIKK